MREQIVQTQNWIRRVQRSSDKTKRVWLVVLAGCSMMLIIFFWLAYLNFTMPKLKSASNETNEANAPFWGVLGQGLDVIGEGMWKEVRNAKEGFTSFKEVVKKKMNNLSNEFTIEGQ